MKLHESSIALIHGVEKNYVDTHSILLRNYSCTLNRHSDSWDTQPQTSLRSSRRWRNFNRAATGSYR